MGKDSIACDHCHLTFSPEVMLSQETTNGLKFFCCKGCQGVYNLIHDDGLERFYEEVKNTKLTPVNKHLDDSLRFDSPSFTQEFVKQNGALLEVSLIIEGIHCAACVWLNEKVLFEMDGVVDVSINFSTNKAKIQWDPSLVKLSKIIDTIRSVGYDAYAYDPKVSEIKTNRLRKEYYRRLIVAVFAAMNIMWIAIAQYSGAFSGMDQSVRTILNVTEWILATPVLFYSGWIFFRGAYFGLKNGFVTMDMLVASGASLTYIYSVYITILGIGEAYFDSVTMIIAIVLFGKFLEVISKKTASDTLDTLNKHIPLEVRRVVSGGTQLATVHDIKVGDILEVQAGERFALDGEVTRGTSDVDESSLTGETEPIVKELGDKIISGTSNLTGVIHYQVSKDYEHSTFSKLIGLLEDALTKKPKIEALANKLSGHFSTLILLFALGTFIVWLFPYDATWEHFNTAFMVGISVVVIACPCALALATPIATVIGVSMGAKKGILFKEARFLETLAQTTTVFLDKTGTITEGKPSVVGMTQYDGYDENVIISLVSNSIHPIAKGVKQYYGAGKGNYLFDDVESIAARGLKGSIGDDIILGGSARFLSEEGILVPSVESEASLFFIAKNGQLMAHYELFDALKPGIKELVAYLDVNKISVSMLTGDHPRNARKIANEVGISNIYAGLLPNEKAHFVKQAREKGENVMMVGDGINDILALAHANIAIAMGKGADVAVNASDVILLHDDIKSLQETFIIAKRSMRLIKENLALSLVYNVITIPLAMAGYVIPLVAALSMSLSSLIVVGNSLRVKWMKG